MIKNLVIIDSRVSNYQELINNPAPDTDYFVLDPDRSARLQMDIGFLQRGTYSELDSIQLVTLGSEGTLQLGSEIINSANISDYSYTLRMLGSLLKDSGEVHVYGSNIASGIEGKAFIDSLSENFQADVAASDDLSGNPSFGGDWDLEYQTGTIESQTAFETSLIEGNLSLPAGPLNIEGTAGDDVLVGATANDTLSGGAGSDTLVGGEGNDSLDGGSGADIMIGGTGDDRYVVDDMLDIVIEKAGEGRDQIQTSFDYSLGDNIEDLHVSKNGFDAHLTGNGNNLGNFLSGSAWHLELNGLDGNDTLSGAGYEVVLSGGNGNDKLSAQGTINILDGGAGNDSLSGFWSGTTTTMYGGDGNDVLTGRAADDIMFGGTGNDTYLVNKTSQQLTELSDEGYDKVIAYVSYTLGENFEELVLNSGASVIDAIGNNLDNRLTGNSNANLLQGLAGNDTLDGGSGADSMIGGSGDDTYKVDNALDSVVEQTGEGIDTVISTINSYILNANVENLQLMYSAVSGVGNELANTLTGNFIENYLDGQQGNDTLFGNAGDDSLYGGEGNDSLDGGSGADIMIGGTGDDRYVVDDVLDIVIEEAGEGRDQIQTSFDYSLGENIEDLNVSKDGFDVHLTGNGNNLGNFLSGSAWHLELNGLDGNDTLSGAGYEVVLSGGNGNDQLSAQGTINILDGGAGNDSLSGFWSGTSTTMYGGDGNDVLTGKAADDIMFGGTGNDTYLVNKTSQQLTELSDEGYDKVIASVSYTLGENFEELALDWGASVIDAIGNNLDNRLTGNSNANLLQGLAGNDTLDGGSGADSMIGGSGDDTYKVDNALDSVVEQAGEGIDTVISTIDSYILNANVENLQLMYSAVSGVGNELANTLTGNFIENYLDGQQGNDTLFGNAGDDSLYGGSGDDILDGGSGADLMSGGTGDDTYVVDDVLDAITEKSGEGIDTIITSVDNYSLGSNLEYLTLTDAAITGNGNAKDNRLTGNELDNVLNGKDGRDTLVGAEGQDTLNGGLGADYLSGGSGADSLLGGSGNDTLFGGTGADTLTGGTGQDTFWYISLSDSSADSSGRDVITDFIRGIDVIDLSILDADSTQAGNQAFTGLISKTATFTAAGQLQLLDGVLYANTDADADAEFSIQLLGISSLGNSDFIL